MLTSRAIPDALWTRARRLLVFYFAHRGMANAEDLAHDTLAELFRRSDFEFEREEDFQRVCYGFASRVLKAALRKELRCCASELDDNLPAAAHRTQGLTPTETAVFLEEVIIKGRSGLSEADWEAIRAAAMDDHAGTSTGDDPDAANRLRVRLHRARKRLSRLTGWKR